MAIRLAVGKVMGAARLLASNTVDGCVCDPPYGLDLLGKDWDRAVPPVEEWAEIHRVLKPGSYLMAFGGSRTHDILMGNLRRAGFHLPDTLNWIHSNGFPGGQNISAAIRKNLADPNVRKDLAWDGYRTRLKPAWEPIIMAQKPVAGAIVTNVLTWGVGGLNLAGCMIPASDKPRFPNGDYANAGLFGVGARREGDQHPTERFPSNVIVTHHSDCEPNTSGLLGSVGNGQCHPDCAVRLLNEHAGRDVSRFFYCGRVTTKERNLGLDGEKNDHPCLKPLHLCEYLARLILPPYQGTPRTILVPYAGSGSEMIGSMLAGWDDVRGIEIDRHYADIAKKRVRYWREQAQAAVTKVCCTK